MTLILVSRHVVCEDMSWTAGEALFAALEIATLMKAGRATCTFQIKEISEYIFIVTPVEFARPLWTHLSLYIILYATLVKLSQSYALLNFDTNNVILTVVKFIVLKLHSTCDFTLHFTNHFESKSISILIILLFDFRNNFLSGPIHL